jgi:hypothetical protein
MGGKWPSEDMNPAYNETQIKPSGIGLIDGCGTSMHVGDGGCCRGYEMLLYGVRF